MAAISNSAPKRPAWADVDLSGRPHRLHVAAMDRAFFRGVIAGRWLVQADIATDAKLSRSTVSRFMNGRGGSIHTALAVLAVLGLSFDDVAQPRDEDQRPV
jgi:hypothetical protein